jgi:phospholipid-binding lipoprotein MlaA
LGEDMSLTRKELMRLQLILPLLFASIPVLAQTAPQQVVTQADPWEGYNRWMFKVNMAVDRVTLKPAARAWKAAAPKPVQRGFGNVIRNISEPWTFGNAVLQGKADTSFRTLGRFLINSTVGLGGLFNVAGQWGVKQDEEDFGQTLAVWGVPSGPYLMLPGFGPSNPRDTIGRIVKIIYEPVDIIVSNEISNLAGYGLTAAEVFDVRVQLVDTADPILEKSDDPYVTTRSAWYQNRPYRILDGKVPAKASDDPFEEDAADAPPTSEPAPPQPQAQNSVRATGDLCIARDCSPVELDAAMDSARAGMGSEAAVSKAQGALLQK